jgi:glycogen synthase
MRHLPRVAKEISDQRTVVITPWHEKAFRRTPTATEVGSLQVPCGIHDIEVHVMFDSSSFGVDYYFLKPGRMVVSERHAHRFEGAVRNLGLHMMFVKRGQSRDMFPSLDEVPLFDGSPHPYRTKDHATLVRDSLFFGVAVIRSLPVILPGEWILFLQDWETATTAMAAAGSAMAKNVHCILTLHNSYDSGGLLGPLEIFGINVGLCSGQGDLEAPSILERALPLVSHHIFTVSAQFSEDLTDDVLQSRVIGPQLAPLIRGRIRGVDNGPFAPTLEEELGSARSQDDIDRLTAKSGALVDAKVGNHERFFEWKNARREYFCEVVANYKFDEPDFPPRDLPEDVRRNWKPFWGDRARFLQRGRLGVPWFVIGGRDDSRQRGHDVAAAAAQQFLSVGGDALFIFPVIPGDEELEGLRFLYDRARDSDGRIIVLPFPFQEGYLAALEGAAYGIFPSLYEPFGGASDIYSQATLAIARATGGLVQQVVPLRAARCYSHAVDREVSAWHSVSARPTGLLYREELDEEAAIIAWEKINAAGYAVDSSDRVDQRKQFVVFQRMQRELLNAIYDAVRIWNNPRLYVEMVLGGMAHIESTFSWYRAAGEYLRAIEEYSN